MKPHKHAELIKQWADGAEIESLCEGSGEWFECLDNRPHWYTNVQYRIKPQRKWYRVAEFKNSEGRTWTFTADEQASEISTENSSFYCRWLTDRIYYD